MKSPVRPLSLSHATLPMPLSPRGALAGALELDTFLAATVPQVCAVVSRLKKAVVVLVKKWWPESRISAVSLVGIGYDSARAGVWDSTAGERAAAQVALKRVAFAPRVAGVSVPRPVLQV